ncbi:antitoxin VbhA family protein [Hymenobacter sedentarius]|nr:antitoxin VbhA family protein [Hymenobacter sedentarius]
MHQQPAPFPAEQSRQRAVAFALALTRDTRLAPQPYEQMLLDQFVRGEMTIDQVLSSLETSEPGLPAGGLHFEPLK